MGNFIENFDMYHSSKFVQCGKKAINQKANDMIKNPQPLFVIKVTYLTIILEIYKKYYCIHTHKKE